jgi:predicted nucleic acid-binding protein
LSAILVDSNVILDLLEEDPKWFSWSSGAIGHHGERSPLAINPIIYAEVSMQYDTIEKVDELVPTGIFRRLPLPWEAAFLAGKCFLTYKRRGGAKNSVLPDFYIGAHAAVTGMALMTRDAKRFRDYFPKLEIITP